MVLGLAQPSQAVREKRSAPSTPPRVHVERAHAEESGKPGIGGAVAEARTRLLLLSRPPPIVRWSEESLTNQRVERNPYQQPRL
jgi:hypothetical protein